jgi:hypothetical protein
VDSSKLGGENPAISTPNDETPQYPRHRVNGRLSRTSEYVDVVDHSIS